MAIRGASGGSTVKGMPLTSQCNGVNKTFSISACTSVEMLVGTDWPIIYDPVNDYSYTSSSITLTSAVSAPSSGATLIAILNI